MSDNSGSLTSTQKTKKKRGMRVKVYLVLQRVNVPDKEPAHEKIMGAFLTKDLADEFSQQNVGTYVHKIVATKGKKGSNHAN